MLKNLSALLLGGSCFLCRGAASDVLCGPCIESLPRLPEEGCPRCALPSPASAICGRCLAQPPRYDATVAALWYEFPADALVHALKFRGELALAPLLARLLAERLRGGPPVDFVLAVPLSSGRLAERGYNQSLELARRLAAGAGAPLEPTGCTRIRETPQQANLPWAERARNVRGAFRSERGFAGQTIAVVDDVMTTGATLDELAATLKAAGAERVVNWVLARTPPPA